MLIPLIIHCILAETKYYSTTTGIIIILVVCCVVGTSLVWVLIIYHTRKQRRHYASPHAGTSTPMPKALSISQLVPGPSLEKITMQGMMKGKRGRGRPRTRWWDNILARVG